MIYIFTALYPEAKPLIRAFSLKKAVTGLPFDVYENADNDLRLVITGAGMTAAACGVSAVLGKYGAGEKDHLINIGTCAAENPASEKKYDTKKGYREVYLCHKITDRNTGHTYYPDMLYHHSFAEAQIITEPVVWEMSGDNLDKLHLSGKQHINDCRVLLHDMESAAVYQAGAFWLGPHRMSFIKVVSDEGAGEKITPQTLECVVENNIEQIKAYVSDLGQALEPDEERLRREQYCMNTAEQLCQELHCSQTMRAAVVQCVRYWTLADVNYQKVLDTMRADGKLPCHDRREGKKRFEELKQRLL
jgi:nucleoside phosphorylase